MHARTRAAIASLIVLYGCASTPQLPPIRGGASVAIEVTSSAPSAGATAIENRAVGSDASTGYKAGALAGGLWGLVCGPFAVLCIPMGAGIGALTGGAAGVGVGLTGALSAEKSAQLRGRLKQSLQKSPPADDLRRNVTDRARLHWRVAADDASETVTIELLELVLTSTRDEQIGFVATVLVSVRHGGAQRAVTQKRYQYLGPDSSLAVWLDERSDFVDTSIHVAMQQLALQIVSELARG